LNWRGINYFGCGYILCVDQCYSLYTLHYKSRGISYVVALSVLSFSPVLGCRVCIGVVGFLVWPL